jgi:hypothetical protein
MRICGSWPSFLSKKTMPASRLLKEQVRRLSPSNLSDSAFGASSYACFNPLERLPRMRLVELLARLVWRHALQVGIAIRSIKPLASKPRLSVSRLLMRLGFREAAQSAGRGP